LPQIDPTTSDDSTCSLPRTMDRWKGPSGAEARSQAAGSAARGIAFPRGIWNDRPWDTQDVKTQREQKDELFWRRELTAASVTIGQLLEDEARRPSRMFTLPCRNGSVDVSRDQGNRLPNAPPGMPVRAGIGPPKAFHAGTWIRMRGRSTNHPSYRQSPCPCSPSLPAPPPFVGRGR
jgi:hypothetical protein